MTTIQRRFEVRAQQFRVAPGGSSISAGKLLRFGHQTKCRQRCICLPIEQAAKIYLAVPALKTMAPGRGFGQGTSSTKRVPKTLEIFGEVLEVLFSKTLDLSRLFKTSQGFSRLA